MRAWPLNQPHAQLVVDGIKAVETRPRPTRTLVGERVAIHANLSHAWDHRRSDWPFSEYDLSGCAYGALIGTVIVTDCIRMTAAYVRFMRESWPREFALGDYAVGRWAFALKGARRFEEPVPWRGSQGVFMVPDDLLGLGAAA
jgi:hypothetical protein